MYNFSGVNSLLPLTLGRKEGRNEGGRERRKEERWREAGREEGKEGRTKEGKIPNSCIVLDRFS